MTLLETMSLARRNGITPANLHPLLALMSDPPMGPTRIAEVCGVTIAAVTPLIDNLVALGMVIRAGPTADRRARKLVPTERAFELFGEIIEEIEKA